MNRNRSADDERTNVAIVASAVSDRADIDWAAQERASADAPQLALLAQLRVIEGIARFHGPFPQEHQAAETPVPPYVASGLPERWAHLELRGILGRGTSGVVFRALDAKLDREVAVKLLAGPDAAGTTNEVIAEGRHLARIRHPHVVTVYGADRFDGRIGIWMEMIVGGTLESIIRAQGALGAREAALVGIDVCSALAAVHRAGLLHRDVKAQNVMRERGGRIVLMDLGAGLELLPTDDTAVDTTGTPSYMAPELFAGARPSVQTDIYSVGMLLFRLLTDSHAVEAGTIRELKDAHKGGRRRRLRDVRPDVPVPLDEVIERALAFDPAARYESASAMEYALMAALGMVATPATTAAPGHGRWRRAATRPIPAWLTAVLLVTTVALVVATTGLDQWRSGEPAGPASGAARSATGPASTDALSEDERRIWTGYEELAANHIAGGNWMEASVLFGRAYPTFANKWGVDTPMVGYLEARENWAAYMGGGDMRKGYGFDLSLFKLEQELGPLHPYTITNLMAKAAYLQEQAQYPGSLAAMLDALGRRGRLMRQLGGAAPGQTAPELQVPLGRWETVARESRIAADTDADWIPDAVESIIGTDPQRPDTDGDGVLDGDEDSDRDGWPNCADFCQGWDPTKIIAHVGAIDPQRLGFGTKRAFDSGPTKEAVSGWSVSTTNQQGYYYWSIPAGLKKLALQRGWRYTSAGAHREGTSWVQLDLSPASGRWDVGLDRTSGGGLKARVISSVLPPEGRDFNVGTGSTWPPLGLEYDPRRKDARLLVNWRPEPFRFNAHQQFLEGLGMVFGAHNSLGKAPRGQADFYLVMFEVR